MYQSKMKLEFLLSNDADSSRPPYSTTSSAARRQSSSTHGHNTSSSHRPHSMHSTMASSSTAASASQRVKSHKCFCGRAFNKREHLKRHKLLVHEEQRPFECTTCELRFGTKQNMQVHLTTRKHRQRVAFLTPRAPAPM